MANQAFLKETIQELVKRDWNLPAIEARYNILATEGIPRKLISSDHITNLKQEILSRVQRRGEEYEFLSHGCAKGTALALMEEFGLGDIKIIKALSPFPGFGMTGWMCGAISGGLIALGLFFGSDDVLDFEGSGRAITAARKFMPRFEDEVGSVLCPKIQEEIVFGRYMDTRRSPENLEAFRRENGYARCALLSGIGARLAAEIIIESLEDRNLV